MKIMVTVAILTICMGWKGIILEKKLCFREKKITFLETNLHQAPGMPSLGPLVLWFSGPFNPGFWRTQHKKYIGINKCRKYEERKRGKIEKQDNKQIQF